MLIVTIIQFNRHPPAIDLQTKQMNYRDKVAVQEEQTPFCGPHSGDDHQPVQYTLSVSSSSNGDLGQQMGDF